MRNGIVVVVEGVNTGLVGAYGTNTAITPALDRVAAHGLVLDQCFVDSLDLKQQLYSLWTAKHAAANLSPSADSGWTFWKHITACDYEACLVTDCAVTAKIAEQLGCPRVTLVEVDAPAIAAESWIECAAMRVFVAAIEELSCDLPNQLVWIHSRGLRHAWDAPVDLRSKFIDPEDPEPPGEACVPHIVINEDTDPDEIVGWAQVAAAQVAVIDQGIEILMNTIEQRDDASNWAWMIASPGGVPLGEHGVLGWDSQQLHGEEISCLALIKTEMAPAIGARRAELCQLPDLAITFLDALQTQQALPENVWGQSLLRLGPFAAPVDWPAGYQAACIVDGRSQRWIRTPAWSVSVVADQQPKLFVKPDDRWEISDVATRRSDIVERLLQLADQFERCVQSESRDNLPPLDEDLCNLMR